MHQGELDVALNLSVDDVSTVVQHGTLIWLKQRASVMRPTVFQIKESLGEVSREAGFPFDSLSRTNICDETVHVIVFVGCHDDLQRVHKYKSCQPLGLLTTPSSNSTIRKVPNQDQFFAG